MSLQTFPLAELLLPSPAPIRIGTNRLGFEAQTLTSGKSAGVQQVTLNCGDKSVIVWPTRGMGIGAAFHRGIRFGWDSPIAEPVHPNWVPISEPSGLGWLDGFNELVVRCGLGSNGAPEFDASGKLLWPLHGRIANLPATNVTVSIDDAAGSISLSGIVEESRFHFYRWQLETTITLRETSNEVEIADRVTNKSDRPGTFQLLYHCNFGPPILEAGSGIVAEINSVTPRDERAQAGLEHWDSFFAPASGYTEEVYFVELKADEQNQSQVTLFNADASLGATVRYSANTLPCFSLWKNTVGLNDGYVVGLEPATNFPNPRSVEEAAGRVVPLAPGASVDFGIAIGMLVN